LSGHGDRYYELFQWYSPRTSEERELMKVCGVSHPTLNRFGVVRDHMLGISAGWRHRVPPILLRHPDNLQWGSRRRKINAKGIADARAGMDAVQALFERITAYTGDWFEHAAALELIAIPAGPVL
jgi:hypothetical protein